MEILRVISIIMSICWTDWTGLTLLLQSPFRYLRIKRHNQTYFIMCQPTDTVGYLKEQVALANKEVQADQLRLILPTTATSPTPTILQDDSATLSKYSDTIVNESELHVVFQISETEWEAVNIQDVENPTAAAAAAAASLEA